MIGGVLEGCPAGLLLSEEAVRYELARRRPGFTPESSSRREPDEVEIVSGLFEGVTTGMPVAFLVRNRDARAADYESLRTLYRPSHADYAWAQKYGIRDHRGGGRASAREQVARVVGGAIARQYLGLQGIEICSFTTGVGTVQLDSATPLVLTGKPEEHPLSCPDRQKEEEMLRLIHRMQAEGDTVGAMVTCVIRGVPAGVGEPVFDRLAASLAAAMFSIQAVKGFEYGAGFEAASGQGSRLNDSWEVRDGRIRAATNHSGGIQGGVSNGEEIRFRVAFKPIPSVRISQQTVTTAGQETEVTLTGRHDPCVVPRVLPVVEAMAAMTLLDGMLQAGLYPLKITADTF